VCSPLPPKGEGVFFKNITEMVLLFSLFLLKYLDNLPMSWYEIVIVAAAIKFAEFLSNKKP
jgi:hypothetical protein